MYPPHLYLLEQHRAPSNNWQKTSEYQIKQQNIIVRQFLKLISKHNVAISYLQVKKQTQHSLSLTKTFSTCKWTKDIAKTMQICWKIRSV